MTHSQIVTAHRMVGSVIPDTQLALAIIIPMLKAGFVPSTSIVMSVESQSRILCQILQIRFVSYASLKKKRRITYIIFDGRIASSKKAWAWRPYEGSNKHNHHCHISFAKEADNDGAFFQVPMLGASQ
jgi:hypothetical protein